MSITAAIEQEFRTWLDFLNDIRDIGIDEDFGIPQVAVIGDQSSGKSSLLNSLTGIPFPRGTGLVTKCPTVISLQTKPDTTGYWSGSVSILHTNADQITMSSNIDGTGPVASANDLADRIARLTERLTKQSSSGFSRDSIFVRIEASDVPNLILVDLPGIIRTTTVGQSKDVITEVDNMLNYFMTQPRTIILAVVPANQDIATVDVLERAQRADPSGSRTIGVLTKPDLVDQGSEEEVMSIVTNMKKPLALGYVIVKNRSQAQLRDGLSLADAHAAEEEYFASHKVWKTIPPTNRGINALSKKLTQCLVRQAKEALPGMKYELESRAAAAEKELLDLGDDAPENDFGQRDLLLKLASRLGQILRRISAGDYRDEPALGVGLGAAAGKELRAKYLVGEITRELQERIASQVPDFDSEKYSRTLNDTLQSMRGRELPGFVSARLLMGSVSSDLEGSRLEVERSFSMCVDAYVATAVLLVNKLAGKYPKLASALTALVESCCNVIAQQLNGRITEIFDKISEGSVDDVEMIESINQIRFERFERAMAEVFHSITGKDGGQDKAAMKASITAKLGKVYMKLHAVHSGSGSYSSESEGVGAHVEDARAALRAFWKISTRRLVEDVVSSVDMVLLQRGSEVIEQRILEEAQSWTTPSSTSVSVSELLCEDSTVRTRRNVVRVRQTRLTKALRRIEELSPGCIAVNSAKGNRSNNAEHNSLQSRIRTHDKMKPAGNNNPHGHQGIKQRSSPGSTTRKGVSANAAQNKSTVETSASTSTSAAGVQAKQPTTATATASSTTKSAASSSAAQSQTHERQQERQQSASGPLAVPAVAPVQSSSSSGPLKTPTPTLRPVAETNRVATAPTSVPAVTGKPTAATTATTPGPAQSTAVNRSSSATTPGSSAAAEPCTTVTSTQPPTTTAPALVASTAPAASGAGGGGASSSAVTPLLQPSAGSGPGAGMRTHRDVREVTDEELQQLRLIPSEPEVLAAAAGEGAVAEFRYEDDGDDRGLIYWLGTRGYLKPFTSPMSFGQINVQSSNMDVGEEITIVSRTVKECRTVDESGCWICIDVGLTRGIRPTHVTVTHGSPRPWRDLTNWQIQGRGQGNAQWVTLTIPNNLPHLASKHSVITIPLNNVKGQRFNQIRFLSTGAQKDGSRALHICSVEIYGTLFKLS